MGVGVKRLVRVTSRALGEQVGVRVYVYDDLAHMRRDASAFNGSDHSDTVGVCQARNDDHGRPHRPLVRLHRGHLTNQIVSHEVHHAVTALYGAHLAARRVSVAAHLNHANEAFAHLYSDLFGALVRRLYALGYYD